MPALNPRMIVSWIALAFAMFEAIDAFFIEFPPAALFFAALFAAGWFWIRRGGIGGVVTSRPTCEHGRWTFAGADFKRKRTKWRCPTGQCAPASTWVKADRLHPLIPRETKRFGDLYRGGGAAERELGRLKHEYGLGPLRVRGT